MKHFRENLLVQFSVASFFILVVIAIILSQILSAKIRSDAVQDAVDEAVGASSGRLLDAVSPEDLESPMQGERYDRFHGFVQASVVSERTARVKLWAKDGTVIYSNDPINGDMGLKFPAKENLMKALKGENAVEIKIPADAENAREKYLGTVMEVYTPIVFPGTTEPAGAFEIYQYYGPVADRISTLQTWTYGSISIGFLVLYTSLVSIVWQGWKTITKQRQQLQHVNLELGQSVDELSQSNDNLQMEMSERRRLEEQLLHAQKMESIGRLAGGVAHDFNNLLTPIMGYVHMGATQLPSGHPMCDYLEEIKKSVDRAATLTSKLLAFSRRQVIEPRVIYLNDLITDMDKMLHQLIGAEIELVANKDPELWPVKMDLGQADQIIMNLVLNARDAMPEGGRIEVSTKNVVLDKDHCSECPEAYLGPHILLSVQDNGTGMPEDVKTQIFDPFFTTKEEGKGTGLGLATCYGIIKQSGGHIDVETQLGKGTTFNIYLPRTEDVDQDQEFSEELSQAPRGTETVLLAEDEDAVRRLTAGILRGQGYKVLEASTGVDALSLLAKHPDEKIHLLLTDVAMPQMGGVELAARLGELRPGTLTIFTSGHTSEPVFLADTAESDLNFIQKPFIPAALARKVRQVLDNQSVAVPA